MPNSTTSSLRFSRPRGETNEKKRFSEGFFRFNQHIYIELTLIFLLGFFSVSQKNRPIILTRCLFLQFFIFSAFANSGSGLAENIILSSSNKLTINSHTILFARLLLPLRSREGSDRSLWNIKVNFNCIESLPHSVKNMQAFSILSLVEIWISLAYYYLCKLFAYIFK